MSPNSSRRGRPPESVSINVVRAVAAHANEEPTDLPTLNDVVDTDALDAIFAPRIDGTPRPNGNVSFRYAGVQVTVRADGSVDVTLPDATEE